MTGKSFDMPPINCNGLLFPTSLLEPGGTSVSMNTGRAADGEIGSDAGTRDEEDCFFFSRAWMRGRRSPKKKRRERLSAHTFFIFALFFCPDYTRIFGFLSSFTPSFHFFFRTCHQSNFLSPSGQHSLSLSLCLCQLVSRWL